MCPQGKQFAIWHKNSLGLNIKKQDKTRCIRYQGA